jgi:hypothetical protein
MVAPERFDSLAAAATRRVAQVRAAKGVFLSIMVETGLNRVANDSRVFAPVLWLVVQKVLGITWKTGRCGSVRPEPDPGAAGAGKPSRLWVKHDKVGIRRPWHQSVILETQGRLRFFSCGRIGMMFK